MMGGRRIEAPTSFNGKLRCYRVRLDRGGYDSGGSYWGVGQPLYRIEDDEGLVEEYIRAWDRSEAKEWAWTKYPHARFHR